MTQAHNVRVSARTAELTASDEGAWRFGGVAVGENDILYTDDGTPVLFTPEVLAEYAETQAGEPLSIDHPADEEGQPVYPPPVDEAPGKVPKAGYVPGQGLVYEATTHDETIANGVKAGSYEVSVHPTFDLGDQDPETGAYIPENVDFLDLSVVSKGMSASNTAEWGANAALASWTRQADISDEITSAANDSLRSVSGLGASYAARIREAGVSSAAELAAADTEALADEVGVSTQQMELWAETAEITAAAPDVGDAVRWESSSGGEREPDDYRYGVVVDGLQDKAEDQVLVAVYEPNSDGDGWENRNEQNQMSTENLEVVGSDGKASLPPVSQVTAAAQPPDEGADTSTDADADSGSDNTDMTDQEETPNENEGEQTPDEGGDEPQTLGEMTVDELGSALREQGFVTEDDAPEMLESAEAQKNKSEKVDELIEASDDLDEDDREELMASSEKLIEREHKRVTGEVTASLPGSAGARRQIQAGGGDEDLVEKFGTGMQE